jgi:hypothetical protein
VHFLGKLPYSISIKRFTWSPEWRFCGSSGGVVPQFGFRIISVLHQVVDSTLGLGRPFFFSGSLRANEKSHNAFGDNFLAGQRS